MTVFISVFIMKFLDCSLSTLKNVFLYKNKFFISSILNSASAALFIFVADAMANAPSDQKFIIAGIVFLANLTGGYFPPKVLECLEPDKLYIFVITSKTFEIGTKLADTLRELNIPVSTMISYNGKKVDKSLTCSAFCMTKKDSKIVIHILKSFNNDVKFHILQTHMKNEDELLNEKNKDKEEIEIVNI